MGFVLVQVSREVSCSTVRRSARVLPNGTEKPIGTALVQSFCTKSIVDYRALRCAGVLGFYMKTLLYLYWYNTIYSPQHFRFFP